MGRVYFWTVYSGPLIRLSILAPIPCSFDYYNFVIILEISVSPPNLFFFFKDVLAILGPSHFHMNFQIGWSIYMYNEPINLARIDILAIMSLLSHEQDVSLHLLMSQFLLATYYTVFSVQVFNIFYQIYPQLLHIFDAIVSVHADCSQLI